MAPVEGQGRLRHQITHASHKCSFYPSLDTWICLACGSTASTSTSHSARPCSNPPPPQLGGQGQSVPRQTWPHARLLQSSGVSKRPSTEKVANEHIPPCAEMIVCGPPTPRLPGCVPAGMRERRGQPVRGELDGNLGRQPNDGATTAFESLVFRKHRQRSTHKKSSS